MTKVGDNTKSLEATKSLIAKSEKVLNSLKASTLAKDIDTCKDASDNIAVQETLRVS